MSLGSRREDKRGIRWERQTKPSERADFLNLNDDDTDFLKAYVLSVHERVSDVSREPQQRIWQAADKLADEALAALNDIRWRKFVKVALREGFRALLNRWRSDLRPYRGTDAQRAMEEAHAPTLFET